MKNNPARTIAEWVLIASVFLSIFFFIQFFNHSRTLRKLNASLQTEMANYQNTHAVFNMLMGEAVEYSKQHPDIDPVLQEIGAKPGKNAPAKPAGK